MFAATKPNTMQTLSLKRQIKGLTVIGYLNFETREILPTIEALKESENKAIEAKRSVYNDKKQFCKDLATSIYGMALRAKVWAAKRVLRLKGWSWSNYIAVCNAFRLLRNFNCSVDYLLRVKL